MDLTSLNKKLNTEFNGRVTAGFMEGTQSVNRETGELNDDMSIVLTGKLDRWEEIIRACNMAVDPETQKTGCLNPVHHVVNHIALTGIDFKQRDEFRVSAISDSSLEGMAPDVLVIGGGICGTSIARELMKHKLSLLLVEKESDFAMQSSGRNDGEVHPGVDLSHPSLKLKYVRKGNAIYDKVCSELGVPFKWTGQYVGFRGKALKPAIMAFANSRRHLGVTDTKIISKEQLYKEQPEMNPGYDFALYNERAGVVCPYGLTIAYGENAASNGAAISLNTAVLSMEVSEGRILSVKTNRGTIYPKIVINAAGTFSDIIADMAKDGFFSIHPRRGTNSILDKKASYLTPSIVSFKTLTSTGGHTKGGGILRTIHDNILVGPDAVETWERENFATRRDSIKNVFDKQMIAVAKLNERDIITYFTGVRAPSFEEDFIIERGRATRNMIHVAGIQSPGLTAAPAIALDVEKMTCELLEELGIRVEDNPDFNPIRKPIPSVKNMSLIDRDRLIKQNPDYGVIVCRCEEISKGEIIDALNSPVCVPTIDGIKKRVRPGMGRCQGGFCSPLVAQIIADYMGTEVSEVTKNGDGSYISYGKIK